MISIGVKYCSDSVKSHRGAMRMTDEFALNSAFNIRMYLEENSRCPKSLPGWDNVKIDHHDEEYINYGNEHGFFRLKFSCGKNHKYTVAVLYSFDSESYFTGEGSSPVKIAYGHFSERKYIEVSKKADIDSALKHIYGF